MTKGLTLTLAIAIIFLVTGVMEKGGPIDKFTDAPAHDNLAISDVESEVGTPSDIVLAETRTPDPAPRDNDMWEWFGESTPAKPAAPEPKQQPAWHKSTTEVGVLARERMNLEE